MKSFLKLGTLLLAVSFSFHIAQASEIPAHGIPATDKSSKSELEQIIILIQSDIDEMDHMQDLLSNVDDTHGLMSALGQSIAQANLSLAHIQRTSDLKEARQTAHELNLLLIEFKGMDPLNEILGIHVNHELSF